MSENVSEALTVAEIYPEALQESQKQRWEHLLAKFQELYGTPAEYISRSPGRVNIIGEHIDYMLFSVIPMAVTADFLLAVRLVPGSSTVKLANVLPKFPTREFTIPTTGDLEIDATQHEWSNYFKSGLRGAIELLRKRDGTTRQVGMEILADGTVPSGAGLSSSAAFTCASALASLVAMGEETVNQKDLVNLAVVAERYVGVNSGGMDQSASVLGQAGSALYISFHPALTAKPIAFPTTSPELTFIIADTLVTADKHTTGPINYNLRVVECTLAAQILAKKLNLDALPADAGPLGNTLKGLMDVYYASSTSIPLEQKLEALIDLTKSTLTQEFGYTREEMAAILDTSVDDLVSRYMTRFPIRAERFNLRSRAIHVFSEALRVTRFQALLASSSGSNSDTILTQLGALMNESHDSCRDLYNCSCPELDELCSLARKAGAYGSRLTGAGWGGCSVHLVPQDKVYAVKEAWKKEYYGKKFPDMSPEKIEGAVVVSRPGSGAVLFKVTE
ncbi:ribosomal protein S5 domain 2-type protein [Morchella snyderi]|nr:ribosomal protein S5 domain 2-type protein [Morchella snyderi]